MSIPNVCSICRDEESVVSLAAISGHDHSEQPHYFHLDCIHPWIDQRFFRESRAPECPLCRRIFNQITVRDTDFNHTEIRVPLISPYNLAIAIITRDPVRLAGVAQHSIPHISADNLASAARIGIMYENVPAVQTILESGRVNREAFPSLLARAAEGGNRNCVELIQQHGAPFSTRNRRDAASIARRGGHYSLAYRLYPEITRLPTALLVGTCSMVCLQHFTRALDIHLPNVQELTIELTPAQQLLATALVGIWTYHMLHSAQRV